MTVGEYDFISVDAFNLCLFQIIAEESRELKSFKSAVIFFQIEKKTSIEKSIDAFCDRKLVQLSTCFFSGTFDSSECFNSRRTGIITGIVSKKAHTSATG